MAVLDLSNGSIVDAGLALDTAQFAMRGVLKTVHEFSKGHRRHARHDAGKPAPPEEIDAVLAALSDERRVRHAPQSMEPAAKATVAANLKTWMAYAKAHKLGTGTTLGLSRLAGLSRPTIDDILAGESACAVDTLGKLAGAFGLQAWQMLVPGAAPPTAPVLGDPAWLDAEVKRRTKAAFAHALTEMVELHGKEGRGGRSPGEPFSVGKVATIESSGHLQANAPGTGPKIGAAKRTRKQAAKTKKAA